MENTPFFDFTLLDKERTMVTPEYENYNYVISCALSRDGHDMIATVIKYDQQSHKELVNLFVYTNDCFDDYAIALKRLFYKYRASALVVDANGLGEGLIDCLMRSQVDKETGKEFSGFNDEDIVCPLRVNKTINTEAHKNVKEQLTSGNIKFLVHEDVADKNDLRPHILTSSLLEEMSNLVNSSPKDEDIILERINKNIQKDKFSAFEYGIYYIDMIEN